MYQIICPHHLTIRNYQSFLSNIISPNLSPVSSGPPKKAITFQNVHISTHCDPPGFFYTAPHPNQLNQIISPHHPPIRKNQSFLSSIISPNLSRVLPDPPPQKKKLSVQNVLISTQFDPLAFYTAPQPNQMNLIICPHHLSIRNYQTFLSNIISPISDTLSLTPQKGYNSPKCEYFYIL